MQYFCPIEHRHNTLDIELKKSMREVTRDNNLKIYLCCEERRSLIIGRAEAAKIVTHEVNARYILVIAG